MIREALEAFMAPEVASSVVFAALEQDGGHELPASREQAVAFAKGPLKAVLERRLGAILSRDALTRVEELLARAISAPEPASFQATLRLPSVVGPVSVLVLSASAALGVRLRAALGGERVTVHVVSSLERSLDGVRRAPPDVFVLDGFQIDSLSSEEIESVSKRVPPSTLLVLWESDRPEAATTLRRFKKYRANLLSMERQTGIDPLLDVIKARQSGPAR